MDKRKTFIGGWKTLNDGSRVPVSESEAAEFWELAERIDADRAAAFPTTVDALRGVISAKERLKALGWKQTIFGLENDAEVALAELGSTGIFRAVWQKPYLHYCDCVAEMGRHYIKPIADLTPDELATMDRCSRDHDEWMQAQSAMYARLADAMADEAEATAPDQTGGGE